MRVVDAIATWMEGVGVRHYFGYAGGAIWPFLDALIDHPNMDGIQAKVEQNAVHAADIYYRSSGRIAPVIVTKGPGLLNCVGGLATAMHDTSAVMVIAGAGSTHFYGKAGMQEIYYKGYEDAVNVFRPVVKGTWLVVRPDQVIDALNQAYKTALSGRPGPVFVQVPYDIQLAQVEGEIELPPERMVTSRLRADADSVAKTADLIATAKRPLVLAGGGVVRSEGGAAALKAFVERHDLPFTTTLTAKGIIDEQHPQSLGPVGRSGTDGCGGSDPGGGPPPRRRGSLLRQPHQQLAQGQDLRHRPDPHRAGGRRPVGDRPELPGRCRRRLATPGRSSRTSTRPLRDGAHRMDRRGRPG